MRNPRERWLALGLVVVLGGVGWFVWAGFRSPRAAAAQPEVAVATPGNGPAEVAKVARPEAAPATNERAEIEVATTTAPVVAPETSLAIEPEPENGIPVRVLRGRTEEPIPFAVVTYAAVGARTPLEDVARMAHGTDMYDRLDERGRHYRAGEDGVVLVPRPKSGTIQVACEWNGLWGWLDEWEGNVAEELKLRLYPDSQFTVRVVTGPEKKPVPGAKIAIRYDLGYDDSSILVEKETGPDGTVDFTHTRQYTEWYWAHTETMYVTLAGLFESRVEKAFDPADLPELIELELPPLSELEVFVYDEHGERIDFPAVVRIDRAGDEAFHNDGLTAAVVTEDGRALFEQVEPGLDVKVDVDTVARHDVEEAEGRTAPAGERATLHVHLGKSLPLLSGRLLRPDGTPVAAATRVYVRLSDDGRRRNQPQIRTEEDGKFRVMVGTSLAKVERIHVDITVDDGDDGPSLGAKLEVAGPIPRGARELGDVRLAESPVVAAGRVVDAAGNGIPRAQVTVMTARINNRVTRLASVRTEEDGTFQAHGFHAHPEIQLRASGKSHTRSESIVVPTGSTNVVITLEGAGGIAGSVVFEDELEWFCDFAVARARKQGEEDFMHDDWLERPGFFELNGLKPGLYDVRISMETEIDAGVNVEGVQVVAGEITRDPRLQEVDLHGLARVLKFEIVDPEGEPIEDGHVRYRERGAVAWGDNETWIEEGDAHIFTMMEEMDLYVLADAHRAEFVPGVRDERRIVVEPGLKTRFSWADKMHPGKERALSVRIATNLPEYPELERHISIGQKGEPQDNVLPAAGRYEVRFKVYEIKTEGGNRRWNILGEAEEPLEIRDTAEVQDFKLRLPAELMALLPPPPEDEAADE